MKTSLPRRRWMPLAAALGACLWLALPISAAAPPAVASALAPARTGPAAVAAAGAWTLMPTPSGGPMLSGVSCLSMTDCTSAGSYGSPTKKDLAEHWNGTRWAIQVMPIPAGALVVYLDAVSCSSAAACTAVGHYEASSGISKALAERWNGTTWTIQPTPGPRQPSSYFEMTGVSCPSATSCTAVTSSPVLAEHWNGTTWTIQPTPNLGSSDAELTGVSCWWQGNCIAVGFYQTSSGENQSLAERHAG